jgi:uncharacterized protein YjbJ (UPF0337 family)
MMWDRIQGKWKRSSGSLRAKWGMFICDNSMVFRGNRDQLVGAIQERYGIVGKDVEAQAGEFARSLIFGASTGNPIFLQLLANRLAAEANPKKHFQCRSVCSK